MEGELAMLSERFGEAAAEARAKTKALVEKETLLDAVTAQVCFRSLNHLSPALLFRAVCKILGTAHHIRMPHFHENIGSWELLSCLRFDPSACLI